MQAPPLIRLIQLYNPSYRGPSLIGPVNFGYTARDVQNLQFMLEGYRLAGCPVPGATPVVNP